MDSGPGIDGEDFLCPQRLSDSQPVDGYDAYTRTSGPLTKTIEANGRDVDLKVWLYWGTNDGADVAAELDAKRAIAQATELAVGL